MSRAHLRMSRHVCRSPPEKVQAILPEDGTRFESLELTGCGHTLGGPPSLTYVLSRFGMMEKKSESTLTLSGDLGGFFREVIEETESHTDCAPDAYLKEYVVSLLEAAAQDDGLVAATVDRPLALLLSDAMRAAPAERFHRLREAGDGILLVGGLYRAHLYKSGINDGYVVTLGQRAYASASCLLDVPRGAATVGTDNSFDILHELAAAFSDVMTFLRAVADTMAARAANSASHLARLYEMWRTDRSAHLGRLLRAQGLILSRGAEVMN